LSHFILFLSGKINADLTEQAIYKLQTSLKNDKIYLGICKKTRKQLDGEIKILISF